MSLRSKVILGVLLIDLLVFGILAFLIPNDLRRQKERELQARSALLDLFHALEAAIPDSERSGPDLASILRWPHWNLFADALLMEGKVARTPWVENEESQAGAPVPVPFFFVNPKGRFQRDPAFDTEAAKRRITEAIDRKQLIEDGDTIVLPIVRQRGQEKKIWGGGYFVLAAPEKPLLSIRGILLLTVGSMGLLAFFTYFALSRLVLRPVETLARASRRVAGGDLEASLPVPRRRDEVADLVRSFDEMVAKLRNHQGELRREVEIATEKASRVERELLTAQRLASLGTLAAGIAHEINNPLGGMLNALRALERQDLPLEKRAEYLELLHSGLERIRATVNRVLQISPRQGEPPLVPLAKPLDAARALAAHRFEELEVEFSAALVPQDVQLRGNQGELEQLFLNLFRNSLDAIAEQASRGEAGYRGALRVEVREEGPEVAVLVQDNGCGMKESLLSRALDPFYTTKEVGRGSGLGLFIVYAIVRGMGGRLDLLSRDGEGFRVTMRFPK